MTSEHHESTAADAGESVTPILDVTDLEVSYRINGEWCPVVRSASLTVGPNEVVGLVGESGSGKSVTAMACIGMTPHLGGRITGGEIVFDGSDVTALNEKGWAQLRGRVVSAIFQQPTRTLNPAFTIGQQIAETARLQLGCSKSEAWDRAVDVLERVHITRPAERARQYPHEFSGGMCQRVAIAMAMVGEPRLIIADEPTTALDPTVQRRVLELLLEVQQQTGVGILLITHDLGIVAQTCQRVAVMYAGTVVERQSVEDIFVRPQHPYTSGLVESIPHRGTVSGRLGTIPGHVVPPDVELPGCRFEPRCPHATERCLDGAPPVIPVGIGMTRCVRHAELSLAGVAER
ncbi:MAG: ABC transporter ATP-binding protein [Desertimonas sp.]